jgi:protein-S-isoprenylcysteine O-methyltransferase Ste14
MPPEHALYWLWGGWYASWLISLYWAGRPAAQPKFYAHILYQLATMAGLFLLFGPPLAGIAPYKLWTASDQLGWWLFGLTAFAFLFLWWARLTMGRFWSGYISRLADHRIVDTGPFAIVRHPIYTGIIFAAFLMAIELGTAPALAGAAFFALAFWLKARAEEKFLIRELGPESYGAYRRRVPMLLPFGPKAH